MDDAEVLPLAELLEERRYLAGVAGRLLGDAVAAEQVVDEVYRRWCALPEAGRRRMPAAREWLTRTAVALCLVPGAAARDGEPDAESGFSDRRHRGPATPEEHEPLAHAFGRACLTEDAERLTALLAPDAIAFFDGGGRLRAPTRPVHGGGRVARGLLTLLAHRPRTVLAPHSVNGRTGFVVRYDDQVAAVISVDVADRRVSRVWIVLNPEKLRPWNLPHTAP
ncbi:RNA polymerase subunit sigma [Streptomyces sp. SID13726]|uniref:RNA polymerase subunit sigma n=1 Tax=Streptomyces sp. SID13726 TaxID=2706058 RepID=UPI0013BC0184|nr:RNA polymerase subunit sigma [Streptomyces sp. SID13726]NEA98796.1 RNA polymerase subunit sigma [Streptomyces sp. SID13726]